MPVLYADSMIINNTINNEERAELNDWFDENGYVDVYDWARDSDYSEALDGLWLDEDGNEVDPWVQAYYAKEAAGE